MDLNSDIGKRKVLYYDDDNDDDDDEDGRNDETGHQAGEQEGDNSVRQSRGGQQKQGPRL